MSFSDDINLRRYQCAQCRRTPEKAQELFQGCVCGHRLFRLITKENKALPDLELRMRKDERKDRKRVDFLSVHEVEVGIYDINVEQLLNNKAGKKNSTPVIVGNDGVFSIHLQHQKK